MKVFPFLVAAVLFFAPLAWADGGYGDAGVVSNFIWRGLSQSHDNPALQGGAGYNGPDGLYGAVWGSTMDSGGANVRADLRGGLRSTLSSGVQWNLGVVTHRFDQSALNFTETYLRLGIGSVSGRLSRDWQHRDTYLSVRDRIHLGSGFRLTLHAGHTSGADVPHYSDVAVGLSKQIQSWLLGVWGTDTDLHQSNPSGGAHLWLSIGTAW